MPNPEQLRARDSVVCRTSEATSAREILGHSIREPKRKNLKNTGLGRSPLLVIEEEMQNGNSVFTAAINSPLCANRQNQVYFEIAPSNDFGLDYNDFVADHTALLTKNPSYDKVREKHEGLGKPWKIYSRYGPGQLVSIQNRKELNGPGLIPVIRWSRNKNGERTFVYSPFMHSNEGKRRLQEFIKKPESPFFENICDPALGLYVLAMFSPGQKKWPQNMALPGTHERTMGSTQAPLLALMKEADLLKSPLLPAAEATIRK